MNKTGSIQKKEKLYTLQEVKDKYFAAWDLETLTAKNPYFRVYSSPQSLIQKKVKK